MYAHATWNRLLPFFRLPGRVTQGKQTVWVELRPVNDRQLNRDVRLVCERVEAAQPRLPDGRRLRFSLAGTRSLSLDGQRCKVVRIELIKNASEKFIVAKNLEVGKAAAEAALLTGTCFHLLYCID